MQPGRPEPGYNTVFPRLVPVLASPAQEDLPQRWGALPYTSVREPRMSPSLNRVGHWVWFPFGVVLRFTARSGKRIAVTVVGFVLLLAGIVMIVTPGPGILLIIAGLAVLATEYVWAERLLNLAKHKAAQAKDTITRRGRTGPDENAGGSGTDELAPGQSSSDLAQ